MARATVHNLTEKERALVADTDPTRCGALDEDELVGLTRVRRARDKHVGLNRREITEHVEIAGARGTVSAAPRRSAVKSRVFEGALARVSASLAPCGPQERRNPARRASRRCRSPIRSSVLPTHAATRPRPPGGAPAGTHSRPIERKTTASTRASGPTAKHDATSPVDATGPPRPSGRPRPGMFRRSTPGTPTSPTAPNAPCRRRPTTSPTSVNHRRERWEHARTKASSRRSMASGASVIGRSSRTRPGQLGGGRWRHPQRPGDRRRELRG